MKAQLIAVLVIVGTITMIIVSTSLIGAYKEKAVEQQVNEYLNYGNILSNILVSSGFILNADVPEVNSELEQTADIYDGRILVTDNNLKVIKDTFNGLEEGKTLITSGVVKALKGSNIILTNNINKTIDVSIPVTNPTTKDIVGTISMSYSSQNIYEMEEVLQQKALIYSITLALFVILFAIYFSNKHTKPLNEITNSINHLTEGYMDETISIKGYTELENISDAFNKMVTRLQKLESSRQEFVSNVSHELKTPITSMKVLADSLLTQEGAPAELYREFLVDIADEIDRENKIINDLLSLVKMDKKASELNIINLSINDLLETILKRLRPIAAKRNIELVFESYRAVNADVDEVKISLAISNLIENAIKYNVDDGWVRVSLNADHKFFYVKVADSGIGIPDDAQDNIFERFYRVDKARSRETGGTGLGLSITRNAILMHRGAIKVYSKENEGTTFTVRVPLNYIA